MNIKYKAPRGGLRLAVWYNGVTCSLAESNNSDIIMTMIITARLLMAAWGTQTNNTFNVCCFH